MKKMKQASLKTEKTQGHCHVCGDPSPSDFELCPTCQQCALAGERRRKEDARRMAFGVGSDGVWKLWL